MKRFFLPIFVILCICATTVEAQQAFKQSRFIGSPPGGQACTNCNVPEDGVTHLRFHPSVYETENSNNYLNFTVQVRRLGGSVDNYLSSGAFTLTYDTNVFGLDIGSGSGPSGTKCVSTVGDAFPIGRATYRNPAFTDIRPNFVTIRVSHANRTDTNSPANFGFPSTDFTALGPEWIDYISMRCLIPSGQESNEAGFAFSGTGVIDYIVRQFPGGDAESNSMERTQRSAFFYADNDLRGFRLDGKTWAEDYARFGDGAGVRLKFSKGVAAYASGGSTAAALTAANFAVYDGAGAAVDSAISAVGHTANDPYVTIKLNSALAAGVINLVSTTTSVVRDVDGDDLADGNFVASLHYDSAASTATAIAQNTGFSGGANEAEWTITFSSAIDPDTVTKDNICVTEANGVCMAEGTTATVPVISVKTEGTAPTTLTMVINDAAGAKTGGDRSIEFRRNAVLGTDLRIVEDYQPALRDAIELSDTIGPVINVVAVDADGNPLGNNNLEPMIGPLFDFYNVDFKVTADEDVSDLNDIDSYNVRAIVNGVLTAIPRIPAGSLASSTVTEGGLLRYQIIAQQLGAQASGFTLVRNGAAVLQDGAGNNPIRDINNPTGSVIADGARIDNADDAVATRDNTAPAITLENPTIIPSNNGRNYDVGFDVVSTKPVPTIGDRAAYILLILNNQLSLVQQLNLGAWNINANDDNTSATVSVTGVNLTYFNVGTIDSFTLGRATATALRDADGNTPVKGGGANGTGAIGTGATGRIDNDTEAEIEKDAPVITVPQASLTPSNAGLIYDIRFSVMANEPIPTIGMPDSYGLIHLTSGAAPNNISTPTVRVNDAQTTATVRYRVTFLDSQYAAVRATTGFTLASGSDEGALRDRFGNQPGNRNGLAIAVNGRIDPAAAAVAARDTVGPPLTIATSTATPLTDNPNIFNVVFRITSTENVETLDSSDSYILRRFHGSGSTLFTNNTVVNVSPTAGGSNSNTDATFTYAVTLSSAEIPVTGGFGLFRAASDTALIDDSGNAPVKSDGTTAIAASAEIGTSAERATRETDGANLTVSVTNLEPDDTNAEAQVTLGNGNRYALGFNVRNVEHADKPIANLNERASYTILRKVIGSDILQSTSLTVVSFSSGSAGGLAAASITFLVDIDSQAVTEMTEGFVLALAPGGLLDSNGNPPRFNNTTIMAGAAIDPSVIARRNTIPPQINVVDITFVPDGVVENAYDITFQTTSSETVRGVLDPASYSLLRIVNAGDPATPFDTPPRATTVTETAGVVTVVYEDIVIPADELPHGFTLGRSGTSLRDLSNNDPVDHANPSNEVGNNQALDSDAIGGADEESPRITVRAIGGMVPTSTARQYEVTFEITANETVQGIGNLATYLLLHIDNNDARTVGFGFRPRRISGTVDGSSATLTFNIDQLADLNAVRATKGYTIGVRGAFDGRLKDLAGNLPVKSDDSAIYQTGITIRIGQGELAPITNGVVDVTAVALRDTTPPTLTLARGVLTVSEDLAYGGGFIVGASETIENIGVSTNYQLLRVPLSGNTPDYDNTSVISGVNLVPIVVSNRVSISFGDTILDSPAQARNTYGFILGIASDSTLHDLSGNNITAIANRVETAALRIEKTPPQIGIGTSSFNVNGNAGSYIVGFTVTSIFEAVPTLDEADSYQLVRVIDNAGNADTTMRVPAENIAAVSLGFAGLLVGADDNGAFPTYTITNISPEILRDTEGFTLARSTDPDSLVDRSGNMPTKLSGVSIATGGVMSNIASGEINPIATLESTQPQLTVEAIGMADPASDNINQYMMRFKVESTEAIPDIDDPASYVVLRIPTGGGSPTPTTTTTANAEINSAGDTTTLTYVVATSGLSQTAATAGFTLGRGGTNNDCHLCDYAGNLPAHGGTTTITAGARIDDGAAAVAERDTSQPEITVVAVGTENMEAVPTSGNGNQYTINFTVTSTKAIPGIGNPASYIVLRTLRNGGTPVVISDDGGSLVSGTARGTEATLRYVVATTGAPQTQATAGFTLGRATGACHLCDDTGNLPTHGGSNIAAGARIDDAAAAVAERDTTAPQITVASPTGGSVGVQQADGWRFVTWVRGDAADIPSIEAGASYRVLGVRSDDTFVHVPTSSAPTAAEEGACTPSSNCRQVIANLNPSASDAAQISRFVLSRAPDSLRDIYNNEPVVANTSTEVIVRTANNNPLPLDWTGASYTLDRTNPTITVIPTAGTPVRRSGNRVSGSFTVSSSDFIDELRNNASYVLLRVSTGSTPTVTLTSATINADPAANNDAQSTEVRFEVNDAGLSSTIYTQWRYTLGRLANLTDKEGNPLQDPVTNAAIGANGRIDSRAAALLAIPSGDTMNPIITATATTAANPDAANPLIYTGTFRVVTNEEVSNLADGASYNLLRVTQSNSQGTVIAGATFPNIVAPNSSTSTAIVPFSATLTDIPTVQATTGFRLARRANLLDESGNGPDFTSTVANRERTSPVLTLTQETGTPPTFSGGALNMTAAFRVSGNETIRGIANGDSYQLWLYPRLANNTAGTARLFAAPDGTVSITAASSNQSGQLMNASIVLASPEVARGIYGFTLGRAANLRDLASNEPTRSGGAVINTNNRINEAANGIWLRNIDQPAITVDAVGTLGEEAQPDPNNPLVYTGRFTVSANEVIRNINIADAYQLLRIEGGNSSDIEADLTISSPVGDSTNGYTGATVAFKTTLTDVTLANTEGFTLGNADLQDIAGNAPQTVSGQADRLSDAGTAVALRDRDEPTLTVTSGGAAVPDPANPLSYTGSFTVNADEAVSNLNAPASYSLLRIAKQADNTANTANPVPISATLTPNIVLAGRQATVNFDVTLTNIEMTEDTFGFALAYGAANPGIQNQNGVNPTRGVQGRIDDNVSAIVARDIIAPSFTVRAGLATQGEMMGELVNYRMTFDVSATESVRAINNQASYRLLTLPLAMSIPSTDTITVSAAAANTSTAIVTVMAQVLANDVETLEGFTLGRGDTAGFNLRDLSGNQPTVGDSPIEAGARLDSNARAVAVTERLASIECAAFYPNIGQTELFFKLGSESNVNLDGLILTQGTTLTATVSQMGMTDDEGTILKATVSEITSKQPISVKYTADDGEGNSVESDTLCEVSLGNDSDRDNVPDIVDSNPFDRSVTALNPQTADLSREGTTKLNDYYSRDVVIRSLLIGEAFREFTYVEEIDDRVSEGTFTEEMAMTADEYFGINPNENTKVFTVESSGCRDILAATKAHPLNKVKLDEFCDIGDGEIDFVNEPVGSKRYVWADVNSDGRLIPSDYPDYTIAVLPEINFSGQPSYIFAEPTTRTVTISSYIGDGSGVATVSVRALSRDGASSETTDETFEILDDASQPGIISRVYDITSHGEHPEEGETITRWLAGGNNIWSPTSATLMVQTGGHNLSGIEYAIGINNNINVRVADPANPAEEITRIRQILLYEEDGQSIRKVTSMVANRTYYVVADYDTNKDVENEEIDIAVNISLMDNYVVTTTTEAVMSRVEARRADDLNGEHADIIKLKVNDDITTTTLITAGWQRIGRVEDIRATYLVTGIAPFAHGDTDIDSDRIPDNLVNERDIGQLPVYIGNMTNDNHILTTHDGELPLFFTHTGLAIANDKNQETGRAMGMHYSAANIKYDDINPDTKLLLGLRGSGDESIYSITTFGVSDVEYGFVLDEGTGGTTAELTGGTIYVVFPLAIDDMDLDEMDLIGEPMYLGKYNRRDDSPSWKRFERGTETGFVDTWYAIDRTDAMACPTDIQIYRNEHEAVGEDGMGFIATAYNCIMVVVTDGSPYDESSLDGRVIDPMAASPVEFARGRGAAGRGGGGAIGISDVLLLIGSLVLLIIATSRRRRKQTA